MGFRARGFGFRVKGLGFRVWGLGFGVWGLGCRVWGLEFGVRGLGLRVDQVGEDVHVMPRLQRDKKKERESQVKVPRLGSRKRVLVALLY